MIWVSGDEQAGRPEAWVYCSAIGTVDSVREACPSAIGPPPGTGSDRGGHGGRPGQAAAGPGCTGSASLMMPSHDRSAVFRLVRGRLRAGGLSRAGPGHWLGRGTGRESSPPRACGPQPRHGPEHCPFVRTGGLRLRQPEALRLPDADPGQPARHDSQSPRLRAVPGRSPGLLRAESDAGGLDPKFRPLSRARRPQPHVRPPGLHKLRCRGPGRRRRRARPPAGVRLGPNFRAGPIRRRPGRCVGPAPCRPQSGSESNIHEPAACSGGSTVTRIVSMRPQSAGVRLQIARDSDPARRLSRRGCGSHRIPVVGAAPAG